ncbi:DUF2730 family protein [Aquabacter cavernae]|uniref:DUF2730 family protein n=1 Tax=Aquabacter cavernae TaxID=2496029 RepID=UPI000F8E8F2E|nr:DUF2730 family protein [Aquabacter cavernae]
MPIWLKEWWVVIALALPMAIGFVGWAVRKGLASKDALDAEVRARGEAIGKVHADMMAEISAVDARLRSIEQEVRHLPTADDFADIRNELTRVVTTVEASQREMVSVGRAITRVEDHLMNKKAS